MGFLEASAETKVGQLDVSSTVQQQVVWLDVSVYEAQTVDVVQSQSSLHHVELSNQSEMSILFVNQSEISIYLGTVFGKRVLLHQECHQVTSRQKLHHQVQVEWIL